jgi:large subunit ribosomal protein L10
VNLNEKKELVKDVENRFKKSQAFFVSHNNGLKAQELSSLRKELKSFNAELRVIKNTIIKRAIKDLNYDENLKNEFNGPTAITFSYGDPVLVAKSLIKVEKDTKRFLISSGSLGSKLLKYNDIDILANLPSREELIAKTVRTIAAPLTGFMTVLSAVPRNFMNVLNSIKDKKEQ